MTTTEKIEQALSEGILNYQDIKEIIHLDNVRHAAAEKKHTTVVEQSNKLIHELIELRRLSPSERLRHYNSQILKPKP